MFERDRRVVNASGERGRGAQRNEGESAKHVCLYIDMFVLAYLFMCSRVFSVNLCVF